MRKKIETPDIIQRIGLRVFDFLAYSMAFIAIVGLLLKDTEMTIVFFIMTLINATFAFFTRRKFKAYYEETSDYFLFSGHLRRHHHFHNKVYYENITDWVPLSKRIGVLDKTRPDNSYIYLHFSFTKPEILLRKLIEMTFSGKFSQTDPSNSDDPNREQELIKHLQKTAMAT